MQPRTSREPINPRHPRQCRGGYQNLRAAEQQLGPPAAKKHKLITSENAVPCRASRRQRAAPDTHRLRGPRLLGETMQRLRTVVAGHDTVARAQPPDGHRPAQRHDADAGRQPTLTCRRVPVIGRRRIATMGVAWYRGRQAPRGAFDETCHSACP